jgi:replicative DNA helicase
LLLFERTSPVDILTVTAQLRQQGELEMIGGAYYITELTNRVASAANIEYHSRIIIQKYIQRELIRISTDVINMRMKIPPTYWTCWIKPKRTFLR